MSLEGIEMKNMRSSKVLILPLWLIATFFWGDKLLARQSQDPQILICYYSASGNTKAMAEAVARGASSVRGVRVVLKSIDETSTDDVLNATALILGSPVYNANIAPEVQAFINSWPFENQPLKNKIGAAFSSGGGISIGEELSMLNILHSMLIYGMILIGGDSVEASFGASAITGEEPFAGKDSPAPQFLLKAEGLGKRVAELSLKLKE
jgi:NAD(P)H dehydrogenase (quinone)